ncbi:hypothetical protein [Hyphomicrobium methylovorum]|uniref:hypothetical protein n=1 Tax=Hyphomicrobium methylovorum TaxID=84 RepID=UPI0015E70AE3|nr:hypothetical protein [Hyphomicrobium methylovorum]
MRFRKKPVVVDAVQWRGREDTNRVLNWLAQQGASIAGWLFNDTDITIPTLEGNHRATPGDWIICGVKGEFYPCKPDIFEATYEHVFIPIGLAPELTEEAPDPRSTTGEIIG